MTRSFQAKPAVRESVPLLIGLMGPSGSGKTFSALRLATGIQKVCGGDIYCIDTEARRALHYADDFKFKHIQFDPPFASLDYLEAIEQCVAAGAKVIIVDSMTHEHTGPGGYLLTQKAELERMGGRASASYAAWIKPAGLRQQMVAGIVRLQTNLIFCFRAKEKIEPQVGKDPVHLGFMPVAGEELLFEMTVNCLLLPKSGGVPTWRSDQIGERLMMKLPRQFETIFKDSKPLDESIGAELARWAAGDKVPPRPASQTKDVVEAAPAPTQEVSRPQEPVPVTSEDYIIRWEAIIEQALEDKRDPKELGGMWNKDKKTRDQIEWGEGQFTALKNKVAEAVKQLKDQPKELDSEHEDDSERDQREGT